MCLPSHERDILPNQLLATPSDREDLEQYMDPEAGLGIHCTTADYLHNCTRQPCHDFAAAAVWLACWQLDLLHAHRQGLPQRVRGFLGAGRDWRDGGQDRPLGVARLEQRRSRSKKGQQLAVLPKTQPNKGKTDVSTLDGALLVTMCYDIALSLAPTVAFSSRSVSQTLSSRHPPTQ